MQTWGRLRIRLLVNNTYNFQFSSVSSLLTCSLFIVFGINVVVSVRLMQKLNYTLKMSYIIMKCSRPELLTVRATRIGD
jgi:hypothetical protein